MFRILPETFSCLASAEERKYAARLADFLRTNVPGLGNEPQGALQAQVGKIIGEARRHDFVTENDIAIYALAAGLLGLDFVERYAGVREILLLDATPSERAKLLESFTRNLFETLARI